MSDYGRNDDGQFLNHSVGNIWDQRQAGVNQYDNFASAAEKMRHDRRMAGLDTETGLFLPGGAVFTGGATNHSGAGGGYESGFSPIIKSLFKTLILVPIALALVVGACLWGALKLDGPTMARRVAASQFSGYALADPTSFLSGKALINPIDPAALVSQFHHNAAQQTYGGSARGLAFAQMAYRCQLQQGCRQAVAQSDPSLGQVLPRFAVRFLAPLAAKGDERAASDMCILPIVTGVSFLDVIAAQDACASAVLSNPQLRSARLAQEKMDSSWSGWLAKSYRAMARAIQAIQEL